MQHFGHLNHIYCIKVPAINESTYNNKIQIKKVEFVLYHLKVWGQCNFYLNK